ncbi:MAG: hypothetical protein ACON5F_00780 [Jejuia sp.]
MLIVLGLGCTESVDFEQAENLVLEPVIESSIIFYKANAGDFFVGGSQVNTASDFTEIDIFGGSFIQDNLIKVEFVFETKNSINRPYSLQVDFLDGNSNLLETFTADAPAATNNEVVESIHTETFEGASLANIKQSEFLVFTLTMLPGEAITPDSPGAIELKSKGVFYLNVDL